MWPMKMAPILLLIEIDEVNMAKFSIGEVIHAGLAVKNGAGCTGTITKFEGDYIFLKIGSGKFGTRTVKAHISLCSKLKEN